MTQAATRTNPGVDMAKHNRDRAGTLAAPKETFGRFNRFAVAPVWTRWGGMAWFVWDADLLDDLGEPELVRQADTKEEAVAGLR